MAEREQNQPGTSSTEVSPVDSFTVKVPRQSKVEFTLIGSLLGMNQSQVWTRAFEALKRELATDSDFQKKKQDYAKFIENSVLCGQAPDATSDETSSHP